MTNNYCWAIEATTEDYLIGCLRLAQRMQYLKSKYPVEIIVSNSISDESLNIFKGTNFNITKLDDKLANISLNTSGSLLPLQLVQYDYIYNLEADMLPIKNIDYILEDSITTIDQIVNKNIFTINYSTGFLILKPNIEIYNNIVNILKLEVEPQILENLFYKYLDRLNLINTDFKIPTYKELYHFPTNRKPWKFIINCPRDKKLVDIYNKANEHDFNIYIDNNKNTLLLFEWLCLATRNFISEEGTSNIDMSKLLEEITEGY